MNPPLYAISIHQPWAWLIVHGHKTLENRNWKTTRRGPILIHASKVMDIEKDYVACMAFCLLRKLIPARAFPRIEQLECGGIVGQADITNCVSGSLSPWFIGKHAFVLANARVLPFQPCRGQQGFFKPDLSSALSAPSVVKKLSNPTLPPQAAPCVARRAKHGPNR